MLPPSGGPEAEQAPLINLGRTPGGRSPWVTTSLSHLTGRAPQLPPVDRAAPGTSQLGGLGRLGPSCWLMSCGPTAPDPGVLQACSGPWPLASGPSRAGVIGVLRAGWALEALQPGAGRALALCSPCSPALAWE